MGEQLGWINWGVVIGYLVATTVVGALLAGRQATMRDFFLGGRKLPWPAVSASIIATEISAITIVGVPAIVYAPDGNLTYLMLGVFGSTLARIVVGYLFVPIFYQREIFSPYDYIGQRLGESARAVTTGLFMLGGMLAQGARVYLTALVMDLIVGRSAFAGLAEFTNTSTLTWSIWLIGLIAVGWTLMGGIRTVIWTDAILFLIFLSGSVVALLFIVGELPGGWAELLTVGAAAGKTVWWNTDPSPAAAYTVWTAIIASTWGGVAVYGTDQLLAQRMFCCRGPTEARRAIIVSSVGQVITATVLFVGIGLYGYYQQFPPTAEAADALAENPNNVFPVFVLSQMTRISFPIAGLIVAGIFAAAISSLDSILAALSQTTMSLLVLPRWARTPPDSSDPYSEARDERRKVRVSRILVICWGVALCMMAQVAVAANDKFPLVLNLALSMAGYTAGALLAGFLLAVLRLPYDARGFLFSAPLSVLVVFSVVWHDDWANVVCCVAAGLLLLAWCALFLRGSWTRNDAGKTLLLISGLAIALWLSYYGYLGTGEADDGTLTYTTVAWPWFIPIGSIIAFAYGIILARRLPAEPDRS